MGRWSALRYSRFDAEYSAVFWTPAQPIEGDYRGNLRNIRYSDRSDPHDN